jgi:hypothetical protein
LAPELLEAEGDPDLPRQLPQLDLDLALLVVDVRPQELGRLEDLAALGGNAALSERWLARTPRFAH